jgi:hypothetical protein
MKIRSAKKYYPFCLSIILCLLMISGCFQPVDLGETHVEKATAHIRVTNVSADEFYVLEGLELRNAEGAVAWDDLKLSQGQSRELSTETAGTFTLWYRVKDTWFSANEVKACDGGEVKIALNKSHDFLFTGEKLEITRQDSDGDGYPDIWEAENGFDPENPADGHEVYVSHNGNDKDGNGTEGAPYQTLAKAVDKASRGLGSRARTVVVLDILDWRSGNDRNPEYPGRADSIFYLGKTRAPVTIRPENPADLSNPGVLEGELVDGTRRVLYLDSGANIVLLNMKVTEGKQTGGGVYATGAKLTLGNGTTVTGNESYDVNTDSSGGIYMEDGELIMEPGSSISDNKAYGAAGVGLSFSTLTMRGGKIKNNTALENAGGLSANSCTLDLFDGAEISGNTVGKSGETYGDNAGGVSLAFSTLTMHQGSKISGNRVYSGYGGGLYVTGESTLIMEAGSEISDNHVTVENNDTHAGWGGGLAAVWKSSIVMENGSVISRNTAYTGGGGVHMRSSTSLTMTGGDISGNKVEDSVKTTGRGGGLYLEEGASFTMTGGSIASNTAGIEGGGVYVNSTAGPFIVGSGGIIYGGSPAVPANKNTAKEQSGAGLGHAVYDKKSSTPYNNNIVDFSIP